MLVVAVVVVLVVILALYAVITFNKLVKQRNQVADAWSGIDVQLTRRADLVPNLVETVKGYKLHEQETLERVIAARTGAQGAAKAGDAEEKVSRAVGSLLAVAEAYPDLKANENMMAVQEELTSTENKIAFARQAYNDVVMGYNTKRESFPDNIFAGMFGFKEAELLQATESAEERQAVKVKF